MRQEFLDSLRIEDCFHKSLPIANCELPIGKPRYWGGVAAAVTGFLLLKSVMNARVMSVLSAA